MDWEEAGGVLRQVVKRPRAPKVLFRLHHRRRRSLLQLHLHIVINRDQGKGWDGGGVPPSPPPPSQKTSPRHFKIRTSTQNPLSIQIGRTNILFSSSSCDLSNRPINHPPVCREQYSKVVQKKLRCKKGNSSQKLKNRYHWMIFPFLYTLQPF